MLLTLRRNEWEQLQSMLPVQSLISTSKRAKTFNNPTVDVAKLPPSNSHIHPDNIPRPPPSQSSPLSSLLVWGKGGGGICFCSMCVVGFHLPRALFFPTFSLCLGWLYTCLFFVCGRVRLVWESRWGRELGR